MWGDTSMSAPQLLAGGNIDYLVGDYLAEVTIAIMARQKMSKPDGGFATDFVKTMKANLKTIVEKKVKVVVNAGGVNTEACRKALQEVCEAAKVNLKIGTITGDDLSEHVEQFQKDGVKEMFTGKAFPGMCLSTNAYLGAFPIARALAEGCDVVITGRVVDSALVLGPLIHEFGWTAADFDKLSAGTLAGHLVECGAQATGGLFTDWRQVDSWVNIGFPVVEVSSSGDFLLTKPPKTDGLICPAAVTEQMLYEIHDPGAYHVPDVACDWTQVKIEQVDPDTVRVINARGQPPTSTYKCISTSPTGFKYVCNGQVIGHEAKEKALRVGQTLIARWRAMLKAKKQADFSESRVEAFGGDLESAIRVSVSHTDKKALEPLTREAACASVSMAQGGMVPPGQITPLLSAFCFLVKKDTVPVYVDCGSGPVEYKVDTNGGFIDSASVRCQPVDAKAPTGPTIKMPLRQLCYARSGDKGDAANIGLIARHPDYLPFLRHAVTCERVREFFQPDCKGRVERFDLPGSSSMNFLLHNTLGGGGTSSLHSDPLAKAYGQRLLEMHVDAPAEWGLAASKL
eukprot:TRINITY_DN122130_c0_g1_i1.p1 TRINITY_DN122130_c0_g1~~TRINITY_DN122130_c0_g1_i1.p1  ORF type:complete len:616 (-),score=91.98 TRINITY_DN122130_c0_g1_i1:271-1980(-)